MWGTVVVLRGEGKSAIETLCVGTVVSHVSYSRELLHLILYQNISIYDEGLTDL